MKKQPLVSVIMAEYNTDQKLLKESIKSILNQSYENFELILIDDCGKNNVKKIVTDFKDKRIKLYKNDRNRGLVYSLNKAINLSQGKYIARMDTDDYSYQNRLEIQVTFLENNSSYDLVGGAADFYDGEKIWGEKILNGEITKSELLNGNPLIHPSVLYKKSAIENIGGYLNYNRCEDYATWIEMYTNGYKLYNLKDKVIRYHLSLNDYKKRTIKTRKGYFKMLKEQYIKLKPTKIKIFKQYIKTIIAGIMPWKIMYYYHKKRGKNNG